jgi:FkbM family methyltransferase
MNFGDAVQGLTLWRDETLVYDVGLHRGEDTDYYLKLGYRVVAFEADPILAAECRGRFAAEIAAGRLHIVEGAIAPREQGDRLTFFRSSISVWGTVEPDWEARNRGLGAAITAIQVDRVDIEAAFKAFGVPLYLKIDVEGVRRSSHSVAATRRPSRALHASPSAPRCRRRRQAVSGTRTVASR